MTMWTVNRFWHRPLFTVVASRSMSLPFASPGASLALRTSRPVFLREPHRGWCLDALQLKRHVYCTCLAASLVKELAAFLDTLDCSWSHCTGSCYWERSSIQDSQAVALFFDIRFEDRDHLQCCCSMLSYWRYFIQTATRCCSKDVTVDRLPRRTNQPIIIAQLAMKAQQTILALNMRLYHSHY